jgi:hypothetical protein
MNKELFIEIATEHGEAMKVGNSKKANKLHSKLTKVYENAEKEVERNDELRQVSHNSNQNVKLWAAAFLLKEDTEYAKQVLINIKESGSVFALSASTILDMWNKGMWI